MNIARLKTRVENMMITNHVGSGKNMSHYMSLGRHKFDFLLLSYYFKKPHNKAISALLVVT